jgi:hypothetical protein
MGGEASAVVKSRFGFRYGKSEILKLLRVPRGSVRGKMAKRRRRSVALQRSYGNLFGWESFVFFQSGLPTAGVALAVNDGDDRDKIREDTIDDQIRKSPG